MSPLILFTLLVLPEQGLDREPPHDAALAPLVVGERVTYMRIASDDSAELMMKMRDAGMVRNGMLHGRTRSSIEVHHQGRMIGARCVLSELAVRAQIDIFLPDWRVARVTSSRERMHIEQALANLRQHERRHRDFAVAGAEALRGRLLNLPAETDCEQLRRAVQRLVRQAQSQIRARDSALDYMARVRAQTEATRNASTDSFQSPRRHPVF